MLLHLVIRPILQNQLSAPSKIKFPKMAFAIVPQLATVTYQQILSVYKHTFRFEGSFEAAVCGIYQALYKEINFPGLSAVEDSIRLKTILIQTMETATQNPKDFLFSFLPPPTIYQTPSCYSLCLSILPHNALGIPTIDEEEATEAIAREGSRSRCACCYQHMIQPCKLYPCGTTICRYCLENIVKRQKIPHCPVCTGQQPIELVTLDVSLLNTYKTMKLGCYFAKENAVDVPEKDFLKQVMAAERVGPMMSSCILSTPAAVNEATDLLARSIILSTSQSKERRELCIKRLAQAIYELNDRIAHQHLFLCTETGCLSDLSKHIVDCQYNSDYLKKKHLFHDGPLLTSTALLGKMKGDCVEIVNGFLNRLPKPPGDLTRSTLRGISPGGMLNNQGGSLRKSDGFSRQSFINIINSALRGLIDEKAEMESVYMSKSQCIRPKDPVQTNCWRSSSNKISSGPVQQSINRLRERFRDPEWLTKTPIATRSTMETSQRIPSNSRQSRDSYETLHDELQRPTSRQFLRASTISPRACTNTSMRSSTLFHSGMPISLSPMTRSVHLPDHSSVESPRYRTIVPGTFSLSVPSDRNGRMGRGSFSEPADAIQIPAVFQPGTPKNTSPSRSTNMRLSKIISLSTPESSRTSSVILKNGLSAHTLDLVSHPNCSHCHSLCQRLIAIEQKYHSIKSDYDVSIANLRRELLKRSSAGFYKDELKRKDNEIANLKRYLFKVHPESQATFSPPYSSSPEPSLTQSQIISEYGVPMSMSQLYENNLLPPQMRSSIAMHRQSYDTDRSSVATPSSTSQTNLAGEIVRLKALLAKYGDYPSIKRKLDQAIIETERIKLDNTHLQQLITAKESYANEILSMISVKDLEIQRLQNCILDLHRETELKIAASLKDKQNEINVLKAILASLGRNSDLISIIEEKNREIEQLNTALQLNRSGKPYESEIMRLTVKIEQLENSLIYEWEHMHGSAKCAQPYTS